MLSSIDEQSGLATTVEQIQNATLYTYFSRSVHMEQTDLIRNFCLILYLFESKISTATNIFISESTCGPGTIKFEATGSADSELEIVVELTASRMTQSLRFCRALTFPGYLVTTNRPSETSFECVLYLHTLL